MTVVDTLGHHDSEKMAKNVARIGRRRNGCVTFNIDRFQNKMNDFTFTYGHSFSTMNYFGIAVSPSLDLRGRTVYHDKGFLRRQGGYNNSVPLQLQLHFTL